ncbi:phage baseplate protein [Symbiopectobacterium purcellii]|uniref:phage baseplate protein n=1 Tax=Symbiopectobacterium purcellii TaxID=2871826 RepID=UPI003F8275C4
MARGTQYAWPTNRETECDVSDKLLTPTGPQTNDAESLDYIFKQMLSGYCFIEIVEVKAIKGEAPNLTVDVLPLVARLDQNNQMIQNAVVYNIPVYRAQRGNSAIIMNPVPGDIGWIAVCDRDNSVARANRKASVPGSRRAHSKSDAIYMGGLLNRPPTQFMEFADGALNITSPNPVNITCSKATVAAPQGVTIDTPSAHFTGDVTADGNITDNAGTQASSLKMLRDNYNDHKHPVRGVQPGSSSVISNATDKPS